MNGELYIIACGVLGALLFVLGGTEIPFFKRGFKWLRREVLPVCWGMLAYSAGFEWWQCLGLAVSFDIVFRLPYGDRTPVWLKAVVFCAMPFASLWLGFNAWQVITGVVCFCLWALSNWKPAAKIMDWASVCLLMGALFGITVGKLIAQTY